MDSRRFVLRVGFAFSLSLPALGCGESPDPSVTASEVAVRPAPTPSSEPPRAATPCDAHIAEFARVLGAASGACTTAADCGCYPGGVGGASACGGVTDARTADRLRAIADRFHAEGCDGTIQCAPWICAPKCENARCVR